MFWLCLAFVTGVVAAYLYERTGRRMESDDESTTTDGSLDHARLKALFDEGPVGYQEIDAAGLIVRVNRRECAIHRMAADAMVGRPCWMLVAEDDREQVREEILRKLQGRTTMLPTRRRHTAADGSTVTLETHETLLRTPSGHIRGMLVASYDITDRQKDQEAVFRTTNELKVLFQSVPDTLVRLDGNGVVIDVRIGQPSEFFMRGEDLTGKRLSDAVATEEGQKIAAALSRVRKTHAMVVTEFQVPGVRRTEAYEARICPNYRDEAMVVIRRITERREAEERLEQYAQELERKNEELASALANAREATEMKSRFLANMSHEIRTPMNGILGMTEFLLGSSLSTEQLEYASAVKQSADALLTLINDILDISKIEAGKMRLERIPFDLRLTLEEIASNTAIRARAKGLDFHCEQSATAPPYVVGDPGRLRQVLTNLLGNALKFTDRGRIGLTVEFASENERTVTLRFAVTDTGIGIAPENRDRLFQSFVQGDNSTTRKYGGTGLGLAISKQLVEMMGGEIGFAANPGAGSKFWFTVLFERAPAMVSREEGVPAPAESTEELKGMVVLALTAQGPARASLRKYLETWGCPYIFADDPAAASTLLHKGVEAGSPFQIALVDLDLPRLNAVAVASTVRQDPKLAGVALVALTSAPLRGDGAQLREAGFAGYLQKPVRATTLHRTMREVRRSVPKPPAPEPAMVTRHTIAESRSGAPIGTPSILLAEDNVINQRIALRLLQKLGLEADVVSNGREALAALDRTAYDLILMDCQMPEMDGFEATAEIRRRENGCRRTLVCALTANAMVGDREKCLDAGMDDYISKPVGLAELQATLARLLHREQPSPVKSNPA